MDVDESSLGDGLSDGGAEQLTGASTVQPVDAVNDQRLALGKPVAQHVSEEQVLGRARTATLAQHPLDCAVARPTVR